MQRRIDGERQLGGNRGESGVPLQLVRREDDTKPYRAGGRELFGNGNGCERVQCNKRDHQLDATIGINKFVKQPDGNRRI